MYGTESCKERRRRWGWVAILLTSSTSSASLATEQLTYIETTGDKISSFSWTLEQANRVTVTVREADSLYVNHCDDLGTTLQWRYLATDSDITASRAGDTIEIVGKFRGKAFHSRHDLDSVPWYQTLAYALPRRVAPDESTLVFWTIRPDNLDMIKMQANWEETEKIALNGQELQAHRVRIRPDGLLSLLWHADYWFRVPDGLFLRYEGVHGPPGHPKTVIQYQDAIQAQPTSLMQTSSLKP